MMKMTGASSNLRRVIFYGWNKAAKKVYTKTKKSQEMLTAAVYVIEYVGELDVA